MADAFWNTPDWSGGDHLRSGAVPFWMAPPAMDPDEKFVRRHFNREGLVSLWCGMGLVEVEEEIAYECLTWKEVADDIRKHHIFWHVGVAMPKYGNTMTLTTRET